MEVDVVTEIEIGRSRLEVAPYAVDPDNATSWYRNIKRVEWKSPRPLQVGSQIAFVARFLGRTISYTYEIKEMVPAERLVMATAEGPFAMETTYEFSDTPNGGTKMTLRNRGTPSGFSKIAAPMMTSAMRRANTKDLARLKEICETSDIGGDH
jgi:Polyketide cyclase / dehydrase and lipid transport